MRQATLQKINQVNQLIKKGLGIVEACKKAKLSYATYCKHDKPLSDNDFNWNNDNPIKKAWDIQKLNAEIAKLKAENEALRKFIREFII